jgi:hypothetical protein
MQWIAFPCGARPAAVISLKQVKERMEVEKQS